MHQKNFMQRQNPDLSIVADLNFLLRFLININFY